MCFVTTCVKGVPARPHTLSCQQCRQTLICMSRTCVAALMTTLHVLSINHVHDIGSCYSRARNEQFKSNYSEGRQVCADCSIDQTLHCKHTWMLDDMAGICHVHTTYAFLSSFSTLQTSIPVHLRSLEGHMPRMSQLPGGCLIVSQDHEWKPTSNCKAEHQCFKPQGLIRNSNEVRINTEVCINIDTILCNVYTCGKGIDVQQGEKRSHRETLDLSVSAGHISCISGSAMSDYVLRRLSLQWDSRRKQDTSWHSCVANIR